MKGQFFSIGYRAHDPAEFWGVLEHNRVTHLADVRHHPWSKMPWWRRAALMKGAEDRGIAYTHLRPLGNPYRPPRWNGSWEDLCEVLDAYLQQPSQKAALWWLRDEVEDGARVAVMCACKDGDRCHRARIFHVLGIQPAPLRPFTTEPQQLELFGGATGYGLRATGGDR